MLAPNSFRAILVLVALFCLVGCVTSHLALSADELLEHHANIERDTEALNQCLDSAEMQEHNTRMVARHEGILDSLRKSHGMQY